jgi:AraC-like DNA-binding protein
MTLGFRNLDVMLAIGTEGSGQSGLAASPAILDIKRLHKEFVELEGGGRFLQAADEATAIGASGDPVVKQLSSALTTAKLVNGLHNEIYVDAMRLAIVARLLCLRSEAQQSTRHAGADPAERQKQALQKWRLKQVVQYVDKHLDRKITLPQLAAVAGLSRMHFASQFRAATDLRPHEYLLKRRIERAKELLCQSSMTLVEISLAVGFQTQAHFTTVFKRFVGDTPRQWRNTNSVAADVWTVQSSDLDPGPGRARPMAQALARR